MSTLSTESEKGNVDQDGRAKPGSLGLLCPGQAMLAEDTEDHPSFSNEENRICGLSDIDKISMELLINNRMFTKYLSKADPIKYDEFIKYRETISIYENKIMNITRQLLENPRLKINNDINETFHNYIKTCINYLENDELLKKCTKDSYSDDEVLFDERYMNDLHPTREPAFPKSYWGKQVNKSNNRVEMDMMAFSIQKKI
jgi:hypothetical protein